VSDLFLTEQRALPDADIANQTRARKWLVSLWISSIIIASTGWLGGLFWAAAWLAQRAVS
jgi:hypothetical protein